ncbi:MAG: DUF2345 domain-containing protein [Polaromonas sp.]|nr:DUF2345 domain-containing protein [Polaromonas sp.]
MLTQIHDRSLAPVLRSNRPAPASRDGRPPLSTPCAPAPPAFAAQLQRVKPAYAHASSAGAERAAVLLLQSLEARHKTWLGRGTVRSFTAGSSFVLTQSSLDGLATMVAAHTERDRQFLLTDVIHAGINNLPRDIARALGLDATRPGTAGDVDLLQPWLPEPVRLQASKSGYANAFSALRAAVPWRPWPGADMNDPTGAVLNPRPTAPGLQTATVVGPDGQAQAQAGGADEIHVDRLGRVRIRFPWQSGSHTSAQVSRSSTWVRVVQRRAGGSHGSQWLPRIGQEVLVSFIDGDIDRPLVQAALFNGRGEAGTPATPGGVATAAAPAGAAGAAWYAADAGAAGNAAAFALSSDHMPSAQGSLSGGNAPAWRGAAPGKAAAGARAQNNAAALSGVKTQEFGGAGFNQLVFDDSDAQLRVQLASTQHASQLNLGHLVHQADNRRGSFRGLGFEPRSDAFGAVRAARGVLLSSFGQPPSTASGDNAAGVALARQLVTLAGVLSGAAESHRTTQLAAHLGSHKAGASVSSPKESQLPALLTALKGMVAEGDAEAATSDAAARNVATGQDKLPHATDPVVAITSRAGLALVAGQDLQFTAAESITLAAGDNLHLASGGAARIYTGQSIGMLGGAVKPGQQAAGKGLTLIAGSGAVELQAQAAQLTVAARQNVAVQSKAASVDWAAATKITLATAGGASIVIEAGNITVMCPGKLAVWAGRRSFVGAEKVQYALPALPKGDLTINRKYRFSL